MLTLLAIVLGVLLPLTGFAAAALIYLSPAAPTSDSQRHQRDDR